MQPAKKLKVRSLDTQGLATTRGAAPTRCYGHIGCNVCASDNLRVESRFVYDEYTCAMKLVQITICNNCGTEMQGEVE